MKMTKWFIVFAALVLCVGMGAAQVLAAETCATGSNNFTMLDPGGNLVDGSNTVDFSWDGTLKTSVAASGQTSNATLASSCLFFGAPWTAHDVVVYGPGTYTIDTSCAAGSPGCAGTGPNVTFTVAAGELGAHMLFDWGPSTDIDVVNVWKASSVFGPSPMITGSCGSNSAATVWNWMSKDGNGDGINGIGMVDGPFPGFNANFNVMGGPSPCFDAATRCNDNNTCTVDSCDETTGACSNVVIDLNGTCVATLTKSIAVITPIASVGSGPAYDCTASVDIVVTATGGVADKKMGSKTALATVTLKKNGVEVSHKNNVLLTAGGSPAPVLHFPYQPVAGDKGLVKAGVPAAVKNVFTTEITLGDAKPKVSKVKIPFQCLTTL